MSKVAAVRPGSGDQIRQDTKPQTLALTLHSNWVGWAAWVVEKFHGWGDTKDDGARSSRSTFPHRWAAGLGSSWHNRRGRCQRPWRPAIRMRCFGPYRVRHFRIQIPPRALEYREHGIRVNAICPGMTRTTIFDGVSDDQLAALLARTCARMIAAEAVASLAPFLASDGAARSQVLYR